jgi:hypothetical protein
VPFLEAVEEVCDENDVLDWREFVRFFNGEDFRVQSGGVSR